MTLQPSSLSSLILIAAAVPALAQVSRKASLLASARLIAFGATTNPARAKSFYRETLGLTLIREEPTALVFDANGTQLRVSFVEELTPAKYSILGWRVPDIVDAVKKLRMTEIHFENFGFFQQDELGIWTAPNGDKVAWFKDPDGNLLSVGQVDSLK